jgi:hypothetical protein
VNLRHYGHGAAWGKMDYYPGGMTEVTEVCRPDPFFFRKMSTSKLLPSLNRPVLLSTGSDRLACNQAEIVVIGLGPIGLLHCPDCQALRSGEDFWH